MAKNWFCWRCKDGTLEGEDREYPMWLSPDVVLEFKSRNALREAKQKAAEESLVAKTPAPKSAKVAQAKTPKSNLKTVEELAQFISHLWEAFGEQGVVTIPWVHIEKFMGYPVLEADMAKHLRYHGIQAEGFQAGLRCEVLFMNPVTPQMFETTMKLFLRAKKP